MKETEMDWRDAQRVKGLPDRPDLGLIPSTRAGIRNASRDEVGTDRTGSSWAS